MFAITQDVLNHVISPRQSDTYKGTYGRIVVIGGSLPFGGAGLMSTSAAVASGAGLVTLVSDPINRTPLLSRTPEVMFQDWHNTLAVEHLLKQADVIVVGPGLGLTDPAPALLHQTLSTVKSEQTVIIDGSALTLISQLATWPPTKGHVILTPHQGEWERLSSLPPAQQTPEHNRHFISQLNPVPLIVLKHFHTEIYLNASAPRGVIMAGSPAMATGGMGDTLTGVLAAFIGQFGFSPLTVAAATYCHSAAADRVSASHYVVRPSDLLSIIPQLMHQAALTEPQHTAWPPAWQ